MRYSKPVVALLGIITLTLIGIGTPAMAQDAGGPTTRPFGGGGGRRDPAQMMKMMTDRLKEMMGATDDDWAAIEPRIEKVMTAQREAGGQGMGMGMRMLFGGGQGGGPGGPGGAPPQDEATMTPAAKAARDLQRSIEANSGPDELAAKMAAYRDAQAKAKQQLTDARSSLKELLTHKQEAILLMFGILD